MPSLTTHNLETKERRICSECVGDAFLAGEIKRRGVEDTCFYCESRGSTVTIDQMANEIETAFEQHFYRTASEPSYVEYLMDKEDIGYAWERRGDPVVDVITWIAEIDEQAAQDIQRVLQQRHYDLELEQMGDENPFSSEAHYAGRSADDSESQAEWLHFEESLRTEARYFNSTVEAVLKSTFDGIANHKTDDGRPVIVEVGPDMETKVFYRARTFQSDDNLVEALKFPDKEIGPPPPTAAISGRMNPHGVAVFYGATTGMVALAEVRPPVGSRVVVATFEIIRPLRLLNIEALRAVTVEGSLFDRSYIQREERAKFLQWLSERITRPVMPDDEPFEYLSTQAIADFLASREDPELDGVLYPSAQGGKEETNVVLFHKASRVAELDLPEGVAVYAHLTDYSGDGLEGDYWVSEEVPAVSHDIPFEPPEPDINDPVILPLADAPLPEKYDPRKPSLKLDASSIEVHHIKAVKLVTERHRVTRHRFEKRA